MKLKIFVTLGLIILLILTAGGVLYFGQKQPGSDNLVSTANFEIKKLSDEQAVSLTFDSGDSAILFFTPKGRLFRVKISDNQVTELPLPAIAEGSIRSVSWSNAADDFILTITDQVSETKYYYNSKEKKYLELPKQVKNFDWHNDDRRIVYIWKSGDNINQQLVVANPDASGFKILSELKWSDFTLKASPVNEEALLVRLRIEGETNPVYKANLNSGELETLIEDSKSLSVFWHSEGKKFIYFVASPTLYPKAYVYDLETKLIKDLDLKTNIDKVAPDSTGTFLFASVAKSDNSGEFFVKVDLRNFSKEEYFAPAESIRIKNLLYARGSLYFINIRDSKLYSLSK